MSHVLRFATRYMYDSRLEGITLEVFLRAGGVEPVRLQATVDTGASHCLFERQYSDLLGLTIEEGERRIFSTAAGRFLAFGHEVSIEVLGHQVFSLVYFFADDAIEKNVLGRRGWLDRVRLGIVDYESTLYLSPYSNA